MSDRKLMPCTEGIYQCFTPLPCSLGSLKTGSFCHFVQDLPDTESESSEEDYCHSFGYHLPTQTTDFQDTIKYLLEKLVRFE